MNHLLTNDDLNHPGWTPPFSWYLSRVCWREVARRLGDHPEVIEQSKQHIEEQLHSKDHICSPVYLHRWQEVLTGGMTSVIEVLSSPDDDRSQALRSCAPMPIRRILPPTVRDAIFTQVKQEMRERGLG